MTTNCSFSNSARYEATQCPKCGFVTMCITCHTANIEFKCLNCLHPLPKLPKVIDSIFVKNERGSVNG